MSAAETIAAAIEKLEGLRSASSPGPWRTTPPPDDVDLVSSEGRALLSGGEGYGWFREDADLDAVVTLHRTIDAQLAILRNSRRKADFWLDTYPYTEGERCELALARAILEEASE